MLGEGGGGWRLAEGRWVEAGFQGRWVEAGCQGRGGGWSLVAIHRCT